MLRRMTEQEALGAACVAAGATEDSVFADAMRRGGPAAFFAEMGSSVNSPEEAAAICTYFAVRGGAVVMREETTAERRARHEERDSVNYG
jgi:hypothetical protein